MKQSAAHVRGGVSRARGEVVLHVGLDTSRLEAELAAYPHRLHDDRAHECISAELVACTLGQRERLELRVDIGGRVRHAFRQLRAAFAR